jgi:hypothetical protein
VWLASAKMCEAEGLRNTDLWKRRVLLRLSHAGRVLNVNLKGLKGVMLDRESFVRKNENNESMTGPWP